jgi:hypothetical protein
VSNDISRLTFAEAGSSQEAKRWADSTYWVRDYRQRKRLGLQLRRVRLSHDQVAKLIELPFASIVWRRAATAKSS